MTRRKDAESKFRKLSQIGSNSLGVTLPVSEIKKLGWREKQKLIVKRVPRGFMIIDALTKKRTAK